MTVAPLNIEALRKDFPLLDRTVHDRPIVYLDSASSALQPRVVMEAMDHYYETTPTSIAASTPRPRSPPTSTSTLAWLPGASSGPPIRLTRSFSPRTPRRP